MSRSSKGGANFEKFFPQAPALQQRRSIPSPYPPSSSPAGDRDRDRDRVRSDTPDQATSGPRREHRDSYTSSRRDDSKTTTTSSRMKGEADSRHHGDLLQAVGSASSISTASSVFSSRQHNADMSRRNHTTSSTPLTNGDYSPASKPLPSRYDRYAPSSSRHNTTDRPRSRQENTPQPVEKRRTARPGPGEPKGFKATYDPELDPKLKDNSSERKKRKIQYQAIKVSSFLTTQSTWRFARLDLG